ncbi:23S rRNA (pseudouridine(1915)-N(3))-methyltransferase RlmH [Pullulanibacillus sp. KACC 23026]|uniref:23S rRNA (pseudouridine(1915)-N(3))-methyltransferase RlmH n=1 Tax=Pullulanibacillus sp. KACC 23026 TaxID=3028315 RepID=UPI0023AF5FA6|nr:23S rRNA (pseudouridine(1915)-N(3))-methyltransferase RlmH [Pullulanibacillus sp. KACC 23026]WEG12817.1 23S rRNA (pseudouridine(1915)-N(3))-methyltransferase RlmH [Pullulanibacillus sp. KACC 23026]
MNITILAVGKIKEKYLKQGMDEYIKRLGAYAKINMVEVPDEPAPDSMSEAEIEQVKAAEGEKILSKLSPDHYCFALAIQGKQHTSEAFASEIDRLATYGQSKLAFIIGGSNGLSDAVLKRADAHLSFSKMTFPHQLMRLILLEQIYRAFRINRGEPYHK